MRAAARIQNGLPRSGNTTLFTPLPASPRRRGEGRLDALPSFPGQQCLSPERPAHAPHSAPASGSNRSEAELMQ